MCADRRLVVGIVLSLGLWLGAGSAAAQGREFTGRIERIDAQQLVVDNRMGDQMTFERLDETAVEGQQKRSWQDLRQSDRVTVDWKMADRPRKAYRVHVLPPKEGEGGR